MDKTLRIRRSAPAQACGPGAGPVRVLATGKAPSPLRRLAVSTPKNRGAQLADERQRVKRHCHTRFAKRSTAKVINQMLEYSPNGTDTSPS